MQRAIWAWWALQLRIAELEEELAKTLHSRHGIGGNNPPEPLADPNTIIAGELRVIWEPLQALKAETEAEEPDKARITTLIATLRKGLIAGLKWLASKGDLAADTAIKWGIPAIGGGYFAMNPDKITAVIEAAKHWLGTLP